METGRKAGWDDMFETDVRVFLFFFFFCLLSGGRKEGLGGR